MALSITAKLEPLSYPKLKHFDLFNFVINSRHLKGNPLGDSPLRNNPLLIPKGSQNRKVGLVFVLAGFAGNGTKYLADKGFEQTFLQQLDTLIGKGQAPLANYVFIDAWTFWGGSQFINSKAIGQYGDFITQELYPALIKSLVVDTNKVAIMGQSSGGYGALQLASTHAELFPYCGALAPDCFFEASLLPDFYKAAPFLLKNKNYVTLKKMHEDRLILKQRHGFSIINAIAMTACYSPFKNSQELAWPIDLETGELRPAIWKYWQTHDPIHFMKKRRAQLKKLKGLFLDVGNRDDFHLQFGLRQIHQSLKQQKIHHHYSEFDGGHFDAHERYPLFWQWLKKKWRN